MKLLYYITVISCNGKPEKTARDQESVQYLDMLYPHSSNRLICKLLTTLIAPKGSKDAEENDGAMNLQAQWPMMQVRRRIALSPSVS